MSKMIFANLVMALVLPVSAFAGSSICSGCNEYVNTQCVSSLGLEGDLSTEMLGEYSVQDCRHQAFEMILETDSAAQASCQVVTDGESIRALK